MCFLTQYTHLCIHVTEDFSHFFHTFYNLFVWISLALPANKVDSQIVDKYYKGRYIRKWTTMINSQQVLLNVKKIITEILIWGHHWDMSCDPTIKPVTDWHSVLQLTQVWLEPPSPWDTDVQSRVLMELGFVSATNYSCSPFKFWFHYPKTSKNHNVSHKPQYFEVLKVEHKINLISCFRVKKLKKIISTETLSAGSQMSSFAWTFEIHKPLNTTVLKFEKKHSYNSDG